jgi:hypothetical protein
MHGRLKKYLYLFFEQRIEDVLHILQSESVEYMKLQSILAKDEKILLEALDQDGQKNFATFESTTSSLDAIKTSKLYEQGFFDGIKASRLFTKM